LSLWSDLIGILAGFLLMLPPAKDNTFRFIEARHRRRAANSPWPGLRTIVGDVWKEKRDSYSAFDSLCLTLGGVGLMTSFVLKLVST
jgi:hypothetical protein